MIAKLMRKIFAAMCAVVIMCSMNYCAASKKVVAVIPLENVSGYEEEKVAEIMTEQLIVALHSSGAYTVVERAQLEAIIHEQELQYFVGDPSRAVELGKILGADYSMIGKVTMAVIEQNPTATTISAIGEMLGLGGIGGVAKDFVHKFKGRVQLDIRLIDNTTGAVIVARMIEGNKSGSSGSSALHNACKLAADNFLKNLATVNPFRAHVAEISGNDVYIDKGANDGLSHGEILKVFRETEPIFVNGRNVGMKQTQIGKARVVELHADYAICRMVDSKTARKGDVVSRS